MSDRLKIGKILDVLIVILQINFNELQKLIYILRDWKARVKYQYSIKSNDFSFFCNQKNCLS